MKTITFTNSRLLMDAAALLGLLRFDTRVTQATVDIYRFVDGTQGELRFVVEYRGPVLDVSKMPSLGFGRCCSSTISPVTFTCILIDGRLVQVDTSKERWEVNVSSSVSCDFGKESKLSRIKELETEIRKLRAEVGSLR